MFKLDTGPVAGLLGSSGGLSWRLLDGPGERPTLVSQICREKGGSTTLLHAFPPSMIRTGTPRNYHLVSTATDFEPPVK